MIKKLFRDARTVLIATTFASYILGLLRDRLFARTFGAGSELDAYQAAFLLPDFMLNFLVAGGLTAVFVPMYLEVRARHSERAESFARTVTTFFSLLMLATGIVLAVFAPVLSHLVAPGFTGEERALLVQLMRVLSFSPTIFAISNALGGVLIADGRFLTYGLSPVLYNGGIIIGTLVLSKNMGIMGVVWGTILGALLHLVIRIIEVKRFRFSLRPALNLRLPEFKPFFRLMIPKMFGHPVELATFWGYTAIASLLPAGSIAILNFARNFQSVPISLIGVSLATVSFSAMSASHAKGDKAAFTAEFKRTLWHVAVLGLAASVVMYFFSHLIISVLLGGKAFGPEAVSMTAAVLAAFVLSVPLECVNQQQARAFYALKNTTIPVAAGIANLILSVGAAWIFAQRFGIIGLPYGYMLGSIAKIAIQFALLPRQIRKFEGVYGNENEVSNIITK